LHTFNTLRISGDGLTSGSVGVSVSGPGSVPQPGMGIFAMMASLGTMPLPVPNIHQTTQNGMV